MERTETELVNDLFVGLALDDDRYSVYDVAHHADNMKKLLLMRFRSCVSLSDARKFYQDYLDALREISDSAEEVADRLEALAEPYFKEDEE